MKTVALIGTLDTKAADFAFVRAELEKQGLAVLMVDAGVRGDPPWPPDIAAAEVAAAAGSSLDALRTGGDRASAVEAMARGAASLTRELFDNDRIHAVLGLGGSGGTAIATAAMRALPLGPPKIMVSTVIAGNAATLIGARDIVLIPAITDIAGVNHLSARVYAGAVAALAGMLTAPPPAPDPRPAVAASMFGNTTAAVDRARRFLEERGHQVLVFHATGTGGRIMEDVIAAGQVQGVLEMTTTEWADEMLGGVASAGPHRFEAAGRAGLPQVFVPGCLDMVNFGAADTVPEKYRPRRLYRWGPSTTLLRTDPDENAELGRTLAEKANRALGPVAFFLPLGGLSVLDAPGGDFWWPEADRALFDSIRQTLRDEIPVHELDANINDPEFAEAAAGWLLDKLPTTSTDQPRKDP